MAFHAGFEGQRALRTWKDRVPRLANLGFIRLKPGPLGDLCYAVFFNPYHVVKRAYLDGNVQERKWQALIFRANEVRSFDLDELYDDGNLKGVECRVDADVVRAPDRFMDMKRGVEMWNTVMRTCGLDEHPIPPSKGGEMFGCPRSQLIRF